MIKAIYPGTFDPLTNGHLDIILRIVNMFDEVILAITNGCNKNHLLNLNERVFLIKNVVNNISNIKVSQFKGLVTSFANKKKIKVIVRGLRTVKDMEYEMQMAKMNRCLIPSIETIFMITDNNCSYISSSLVREIIRNEGNIDHFLPKSIADFIRSKFYSSNL